eukprot:211638_1
MTFRCYWPKGCNERLTRKNGKYLSSKIIMEKAIALELNSARYALDKITVQGYMWLCEGHYEVAKADDAMQSNLNKHLKIAYVGSDEHCQIWDEYKDKLVIIDMIDPNAKKLDCNGHKSFFKDEKMGKKVTNG